MGEEGILGASSYCRYDRGSCDGGGYQVSPCARYEEAV
jgi:hypothetical protein